MNEPTKKYINKTNIKQINKQIIKRTNEITNKHATTLTYIHAYTLKHDICINTLKRAPKHTDTRTHSCRNMRESLANNV